MNITPEARTDRARRVGLALALVSAPWGFVVGNASYAIITLHGGSDLTSRDALALAGAHPLAYRLGGLAALLGSILMVPAVLGAMRLMHARLSRIGLIGGILMIGAYVCYFALVYQSFITTAMAQQGGSLGNYVAVLDAAAGDPLTVWVTALFIIGNIVGTFLLGFALLRAGVVARWAAYAVMSWSLLHVVGIIAGSEWFEVVGAFLQAAGLTAVGLRLLHRPTEVAASTPQSGEAAAA